MDIFVLRGGVPEWLKGTGCKPVGVRLRWFESNPLHQLAERGRGTLERMIGSHIDGKQGTVSRDLGMRGCSSMVEQKPSKLTTRVRFPSPAPDLNLRNFVGIDYSLSIMLQQCLPM